MIDENDENKEKDENKSKTPTVEELLAENARLKSHNEKTIGEKRKASDELAKLKAEKEQKRNEDLKQKEDYKTMLEEANKKINNLENTISKKDEDALSKSIAFDVQKLAKDAKDVNDILDKINITDENIDLEKQTITDLAEQIDAIRKSKPYLFESKSSNMNTKLPNLGKNNSMSKSDDDKPLKTRIAEKLLKA